jgi:hypothetical protein
VKKIFISSIYMKQKVIFYLGGLSKERTGSEARRRVANNIGSPGHAEGLQFLLPCCKRLGAGGLGKKLTLLLEIHHIIAYILSRNRKILEIINYNFST